ncbi:hypothetical protein EJB05_42235 [Eragrostis curvula]|uniref:Nucleolus and neural progenitor protein-like N-terminal domain-containing protein n=1 Tax=Eragrostis curvula TaxID=38414 RepID=A0A5J9TBQ2_9POAL|nr:hypothetical protein EJB05_42235 [Eragrostis curvula]
MSQRAEEGDEENRLRAALRHLQAEAGVLERLVYKHRNQHRGAAYFQYLLKVRRDLKLLLGSGLADVINAVFPVLASRKPANTILVPVKQSKKKPSTNHSHHERLLGVARLLSQMAEPVMKAAMYPLAFVVVFFMLALLARVRVLIQQMLLDTVSVYNKVTNLTDRKQAVKISIGGVQAFREYYPSIDDARTILECVWVKDKFVLHEKLKSSLQVTEDEDQRSCGSTIQYETLGLVTEGLNALSFNLHDKYEHPEFLVSLSELIDMLMRLFGALLAEWQEPGADLKTSRFERLVQLLLVFLLTASLLEMKSLEETNSQPDDDLVEHPDKMNHCSDAGAPQSGRQLENENNAASSDTLSTHAPSAHLDVKPETKKRVAFIAVGNPKVTATSSETKSSEVNKKQRLESGDLFRKLLDSENANSSLF